MKYIGPETQEIWMIPMYHVILESEGTFIPRYLRIFLGIQEYSRVSKDIQRKVHAWSRTESLFSLVYVEIFFTNKVFVRIYCPNGLEFFLPLANFPTSRVLQCKYYIYICILLFRNVSILVLQENLTEIRSKMHFAFFS